MIHRIEVGFKNGVSDALGRSIAQKIRDHLRITVKKVDTRNLFFLEAALTTSHLEEAARELFIDPVIQRYAIDENLEGEPFDVSITVGYKPGVTDNVGRTATMALSDLLNRPSQPDEVVYTATQYLLYGVSVRDAERIAEEILANELIEDVLVQSYNEWKRNGLSLRSTRVESIHEPQVLEIDLQVSNEALLEISRSRNLALDLREMQAIRDYFRCSEVLNQRQAVSLGPNPTDVELESLAQTWSEHCHHKIFNGIIHYTDEHGHSKTINSLFRTYIHRVTEEIDADWLLSVFRDNAGVIRFTDNLALVYKVETHNSPSALDPYGGAMTGIVGVNRDPFGTGLGAHLIANVWGYCLGNPFWEHELPKGLLHPRRIRDGVHCGVIEGGNQSGIPYARGWELFEDRYMGKPLVFCGTLGEMPLEIRQVPTWLKEVQPGDQVVMVGGRVGKDGIHGATFSSEELHASSPVQAVQIGDPITQKRMTDMLLEARSQLLYRALTDNGAGGLSSSVGEMANLSGGCEIDLSQVPLKYQGLDPWEILVSEAQERMTLAVPPKKLEAYRKLSEKRNVESAVLGCFNDSGRFHVKYGKRTVAYLDLEFMHRGDPPYELEATYIRKNFEEPEVAVSDHRIFLQAMLRRLNICSIEEKARQYDHEVQGRSIIKPYGGRFFDMPTDATVLLAEYRGKQGIILTEGINPFYSDIDTYWMAASVVDLAVRRVIATGGDPDFIAGLDNFCWPNVVKDMPERSHKLAQLVRANQGLYDTCLAYSVPLISGKDSMSNDSTLTDPPISVPPTLLISVIGRIDDIAKIITMDVKAAGDLVYILGETLPETGGSEFLRCYGEHLRGRAYIGNRVPQLDKEASLRLYRALHRCIQNNQLHSAHTPALGGLGIALAKMSMAGGYGLEIDLRRVPSTVNTDAELLYSESNSRFVVTVAPEKARAFEEQIKGCPAYQVGTVLEEARLRVTGLDGDRIIDEDLQGLKAAWQEPLKL